MNLLALKLPREPSLAPAGSWGADPTANKTKTDNGLVQEPGWFFAKRSLAYKSYQKRRFLKNPRFLLFLSGCCSKTEVFEQL
jgi:hypothetical protein